MVAHVIQPRVPLDRHTYVPHWQPHTQLHIFCNFSSTFVHPRISFVRLFWLVLHLRLYVLLDCLTVWGSLCDHIALWVAATGLDTHVSAPVGLPLRVVFLT